MSKIEISVAIIFKNEIRCLERCLKSLQPLRQRFSAEVVMADTGSTDGSRNLAEQYADVLFDFPWINDFSAARNATLRRCSGAWVLIIDSDEWLDDRLDELEQILRCHKADGFDAVGVLQRNYDTYEPDAAYFDFPAGRLARLTPQLHFEGRIHEELCLTDRPIVYTHSNIILHHDGYVETGDKSEAGKEKLRRNMELLRRELKETPDSLRRWSQVMDCCSQEPDWLELTRRALTLVEAHAPGWQNYGAPILRRAVQTAYEKNLPETALWAEKARRLFPDSYFTRIDAERAEMLYHYQRQDYAACVVPGEAYLQGCVSLRAEESLPTELVYAAVEGSPRRIEENTRILMADIRRLLGHTAQALSHYQAVEWSVLDDTMLFHALEAIARLQRWTDADLGEVIRAVWRSVRPMAEATEQYAARTRKFLAFGRASFSVEESPEAKRPVWQMFLPLRGECILGDYAAAMDARTPEEADAALAAMEDLAALPPAVFVHALKTGAAFPLPERELTVEQSDAMAAKLAEDKPFLREAALFAADAFETAADLVWARSLALTALKANDWAADAEPMALLRAFVKAESAFLPLCYAETALRAPALLPPMQRFALHLVSAFAVLFPDTVSASFTPTGERSVRRALAELKLAVIAAPEQKVAVDALLDRL